MSTENTGRVPNSSARGRINKAEQAPPLAHVVTGQYEFGKLVSVTLKRSEISKCATVMIVPFIIDKNVVKAARHANAHFRDTGQL